MRRERQGDKEAVGEERSRKEREKNRKGMMGKKTMT